MSQLAAQIREVTAAAREDGNFVQERLAPLFEAIHESFRLEPEVIRTKLERGDLTALEQVPYVGRAWIDERKFWSELVLKPEFMARNFDLCQPLLDAALQGDESSRAQYEKNRLILWGSLPEWARDAIALIIEQRFKPLVLRVKDLPELCRQQLVGNPTEFRFSIKGSHVVDLIERVAFTVRSGSAIMEASEAYREYGKLDQARVAEFLRQNLSTPRGPGRPDATAIDPTPVGDFMAKGMECAVMLSFNARLLEDLRVVRGVPLEDRVLRSALSGSQGLWDVLQMSSTKKFLLCAELCGSHVALSEKFGALMIMKDPKSGAANIIAKHEEEETKRQSAQSSPQVEERISHREAMLFAIRAALRAFGNPELKPLQHAGSFYSLIRKGGCNFFEILEGLSQGKSPEELIAIFRERLRVPHEFSVPKIESDPTPIADSAEEKEEHRSYSFRSIAVEESLFALGDNLRRITEARLMRWIETGNVGDAEKLHNAAGLYAMRIHTGQGVRIYFSRPEPRRIEVWHIGTKKNYKDDIHKLAAS